MSLVCQCVATRLKSTYFPQSEHTSRLDTPAEEPLKHTASLLQGTLVSDSEHLCGAAFCSVYDWHLRVNLSKFGWVCGGATDLVNISMDTSKSAVLSLSSLLASFQLCCVSLRLLLVHIRHRLQESTSLKFQHVKVGFSFPLPSVASKENAEGVFFPFKGKCQS